MEVTEIKNAPPLVFKHVFPHLTLIISRCSWDFIDSFYYMEVELPKLQMGSDFFGQEPFIKMF